MIYLISNLWTHGHSLLIKRFYVLNVKHTILSANLHSWSWKTLPSIISLWYLFFLYFSNQFLIIFVTTKKNVFSSLIKRKTFFNWSKGFKSIKSQKRSKVSKDRTIDGRSTSKTTDLHWSNLLKNSIMSLPWVNMNKLTLV